MTSSVAGLRRNFKALNLHQKKVIVTGGLLLILTTTAFWIPAKPLRLKVCSANQWDALKNAMPAAGTGQQKGPSFSPQQRLTACSTTSSSKVGQIGLWSLPHPPYSPDLSRTDLSLLQASWQRFIGKMFPQPAGGRRHFPCICLIPKHRFFTLYGISKHSHWQKCVDCNCSYFN